jgi:hypothetical protein
LSCSCASTRVAPRFSRATTLRPRLPRASAASSGLSGVQMSTARPRTSPRNRAGATPTIVNVRSRSLTDDPITDGSRANARVQNASLTTATSASVDASSSEIPRPSVGVRPRTVK